MLAQVHYQPEFPQDDKTAPTSTTISCVSLTSPCRNPLPFGLGLPCSTQPFCEGNAYSKIELSGSHMWLMGRCSHHHVMESMAGCSGWKDISGSGGYVLWLCSGFVNYKPRRWLPASETMRNCLVLHGKPLNSNAPEPRH